MTIAKSTKRRPDKPYPEFPLFAHNNGQWCRKIRGKLYGFGTWDDPTAALKKHNLEYAFLKEGIQPPDSFDGLTVGELVNDFLAAKEDALQCGDIVQETFDALHYVGKLLVEYVPKHRVVASLTPADFRELRTKIRKRFAASNARVNISRIRQIFKFAYDERMIKQPVYYGQGFDLVSKKVVRTARNKKPKKLLEPCHIHALLAKSSPCLKAMILLSINTGMNNADLGYMGFEHVDLNSGWLDYPRHKTAIERRAKLWPETRRAIRQYIDVRQTPIAEFHQIVFITKARRRWGHSSLPTAFRSLRELVNTDDDGNDLDPYPVPPHATFGYFRHTFATIAGGTRDQVAVNAIMGHVDDSMAAEYRESIEDERLESVAAHVHKWLYGRKAAK